MKEFTSNLREISDFWDYMNDFGSEDLAVRVDRWFASLMEKYEEKCRFFFDWYEFVDYENVTYCRHRSVWEGEPMFRHVASPEKYKKWIIREKTAR